MYFRNLQLVMMKEEKDYKRFRTVGMMEGISFLLLLFVAMPLKYLAGYPMAVKVVGWAHGLLFVVYLYFLIQLAVKYKLSFIQSALGFLAAVMPFGPFLYDRYLVKTVKPL